jgi:hypothetical protein
MPTPTTRTTTSCPDHERCLVQVASYSDGPETVTHLQQVDAATGAAAQAEVFEGRLNDVAARTTAMHQRLDSLVATLAEQGRELQRLTAAVDQAEQARVGSFRRAIAEQVSTEAGPLRNAISEQAKASSVALFDVATRLHRVEATQVAVAARLDALDAQVQQMT